MGRPIWPRSQPRIAGGVAVDGGVLVGFARVGPSQDEDVPPGTGEIPVAPVYVDGEKTVTLKGERVADEFCEIIAAYVRSTYGGEPSELPLKAAKRTISIKATS